jgi:guanylate kinase
MTGKAIIVSAPSGAGKTTIVRELLNAGLGLEFSVSACSRPMREKETDGIDYYFISVEEFKARIARDEFVEWQQVYENQYYGTLKSEAERIWNKGHHIIFDVDVIGGLNLKKIFGKQALSIFIMPPSLEVLEERLRNRSTEDEASLSKRLGKARREIDQSGGFDRIIVNDILGIAVKEAIRTSQEFLS